MPKKAKSKAQARFLGAVAGGSLKKPGLSAAKAGEMLKGTKMSKLPARKKKKKKS
jgi:hypothetical protein